TSWPMIGRPWLASTTSGALLLETASLSVVLRSVKDFATRLMVTFGYFCWNAALSCFICAFWPPRTSWSQTVSVTGPALAMSGADVAVAVGCAFFFLAALFEPGAAPQ